MRGRGNPSNKSGPLRHDSSLFVGGWMRTSAAVWNNSTIVSVEGSL